MFLSRIWCTCVLLKFLYFWGFRWSDGFFIFLQIFAQKFYLGSNKKLVPSNWLWFHSLLFENANTKLPYFLFQFGMEAEDVYFYSQVVVFVLWNVAIIIRSTHLPLLFRKFCLYYPENSPSDNRCQVLYILDGLSTADIFLYWFYKSAFHW